MFARLQKDICLKFGVQYLPCEELSKIGINRSFDPQQFPINGLRHPPTTGTNGWYIWSGNFSAEPDFFVPLHVEHFEQHHPDVAKYLGLEPGWRFLLAPNYEDVWFDPVLLDIE